MTGRSSVTAWRQLAGSVSGDDWSSVTAWQQLAGSVSGDDRSSVTARQQLAGSVSGFLWSRFHEALLPY